MWLRKLTVRNLRLLREETITFPEPRRDSTTDKVISAPWTVLIGRNGAGKTTLLQAIALAAAGNAGATVLAPADDKNQFVDVRAPLAEPRIEAEWTFGDIGRSQPDVRPYPDEAIAPISGLFTEVRIPVGRDPVQAKSWYPGTKRALLEFRPGTEQDDPLVAARTRNLSHWFVAAYGMSRYLQTPQRGDTAPSWAAIDRLRPVFGNKSLPLVGMNFATPGVLKEEVRRVFVATLQKIIQSQPELLPGITNIETRGADRIDGDFAKSNRFEERIGKNNKKLPAIWLAHGHQSTLAWLADLIGQVLLEAGFAVSPQEMEGLVLIDEIDLYLHPTWQVQIIRALRETFPKLQFIATTHSPLLLTGLKQEEVLLLERDPETGDVHARNPNHDPRLLTATELYDYFFEINEAYPTELGRKLEEYSRLASSVFRSDAEDTRVHVLYEEILAEGIPLARKPAARKVRPSDEEAS